MPFANKMLQSTIIIIESEKDEGKKNESSKLKTSHERLININYTFLLFFSFFFCKWMILILFSLSLPLNILGYRRNDIE